MEPINEGGFGPNQKRANINEPRRPRHRRFCQRCRRQIPVTKGHNCRAKK